MYQSVDAYDDVVCSSELLEYDIAELVSVVPRAVSIRLSVEESLTVNHVENCVDDCNVDSNEVEVDNGLADTGSVVVLLPSLLI